MPPSQITVYASYQTVDFFLSLFFSLVASPVPMFLNMSSAPKLKVSSLTPNELSPGKAGGGGPFGFGGWAGANAGCETVRPLE